MVLDLATGSRLRITGFYRMTCKDTARRLLECAPGDPAMEIISTYSVCGKFHRPWDLFWEGPIPWSAKIVAEDRANFQRRIDNPSPVHAITSRGYPSLFAEYPPLSAHDSLRIHSWRLETDDLITAYETTAA